MKKNKEKILTKLEKIKKNTKKQKFTAPKIVCFLFELLLKNAIFFARKGICKSTPSANAELISCGSKPNGSKRI